VAKPTLVACRRFQIGVVQVSAHLADGLLRDVESQLPLGFGQREPEPAP
jgi:hypothetical protein